MNKGKGEKRKTFFLLEGGDLKRILACLYCNKCNKINMWHSDTQNKFLFLFFVLCSEFSTLIIRIFLF